MAQPTAQPDRDLASISEARTLVRRAKQAAPVLAEFSQDQIDAIVDAMAAAVAPQAEPLAQLAHEETGYGVVADKVQKNLFASEKVYKFIRPMKTVGVIRRLEDRKVVEIAEPFGVVCAIVPTTNPTSTAIYKILIALKARCPVVISPHPSAVRCIARVAEIMGEAAREVSVTLATGGMGLVRAAYSAGKPAYGVGPGNAPSFIERTADVPKAVLDVVTGKTFDNGVLCSSENSAVVGKSAAFLAEKAGISIPSGTRVLLALLAGVGRDYPLSIEKPFPVLS